MNLPGNIGPADERYKFGLYVDNLTDKKYYIQRQTSQPFGVIDQVPNRARLSAKF